jgi:hypothetical protein
VRAVAKERLVEISRALQRFPWMTDTMEQSIVGNSHPLRGGGVRGGFEMCLSLNRLKAYGARDGAVSETKLELAF